jgi:hypothetical protein
MTTRASKYRPNEYLYEELSLITSDYFEFNKRFPNNKSFWKLDNALDVNH